MTGTDKRGPKPEEASGFAAFANAMEVCALADHDIAAGETNRLRDPQAGLDRQHDHGVIAVPRLSSPGDPPPLGGRPKPDCRIALLAPGSRPEGVTPAGLHRDALYAEAGRHSLQSPTRLQGAQKSKTGAVALWR
jgi:hypothetical protein